MNGLFTNISHRVWLFATKIGIKGRKLRLYESVMFYSPFNRNVIATEVLLLRTYNISLVIANLILTIGYWKQI